MSLQWASISYYYFCFFLGDTNNVRTGYRSSFFCPGCWRLLRFSRKNNNKKGRWGTGRLSQVSTDCFLNFLWICFVFNRHVPRIFLSMTLYQRAGQVARSTGRQHTQSYPFLFVQELMFCFPPAFRCHHVQQLYIYALLYIRVCLPICHQPAVATSPLQRSRRSIVIDPTHRCNWLAHKKKNLHFFSNASINCYFIQSQTLHTWMNSYRLRIYRNVEAYIWCVYKRM